MHNELIGSRTLAALQLQKKQTDIPSLFVCDFDGTLFTPNMHIMYEILQQNRRIANKLAERHIPLILNTSRSNWQKITQANVSLLSVRSSSLILGAGTLIYHRQANGKALLDITWQNTLLQERITIDNELRAWNEAKTHAYIGELVVKWQTSNPVKLKKRRGNSFLIRYKIWCKNVLQLPDYAASLQNALGKEITVTYLERLHGNKLGYSTGDILIIPRVAGKDKALTFLLKQYATLLKTRLEGFCFGDGSIDLTSFLALPSTQLYTLHTFLVHPTPLARKLYQTQPHSQILFNAKRGPVVIEHILDNPNIYTSNIL